MSLSNYEETRTIRAAVPDDALAISTLLIELTARYIAHELSPEGAKRLLGSMEETAIRRYMASGYRYHVAEAHGELAGVISVRNNQHLYHLFVAEPFQGQGLARALWLTAKSASVEAGNPGVFTVNSSRFAVGMYKNFGFIGHGEMVDQSGVIHIPMQLECRT